MPKASYITDYGGLRLKVREAEDATYEFWVFDGNDGGIFWHGFAPDLKTAQSSALFESQAFIILEPTAPPTWYAQEA